MSVSKTRPETLVSRVADNFSSYVGKGVRIEPFLKSVSPSLDIENIGTLLEIYFVLSEDIGSDETPSVAEFVDKLRERIRRIKTEVQRSSAVQRGEVRGRIDWNETVKLRCRNPETPDTRFVCTEAHVQYQLPENLVLARLLDRIKEIVSGPLASVLEAPDGYEWLGVWASGNGQEGSESGLAEWLARFTADNVYLERVDASQTTVTGRTLQAVRQSRRPLYRNAASLLDIYRRVTSREVDQELARDLLSEFFIGPGDPEALFELYWVFRILSEYEDVEYELIHEGSDSIASWESDSHQYTLYHDSTGSQALSFEERIDDIELPYKSEYLRRQVEAREQWAQICKDLYGRSPHLALWRGRPDILIERVPVGGTEPVGIFIGEVKYSRSPAYIRSGLRQLLEYIQHLRVNGEYAVSVGGNSHVESVSGAVFVDGADSELTAPPYEGSGWTVDLHQFDSEMSRPI